MRIRLAGDTDLKAWDDYVTNHPQGTCYHLTAWTQAVGKSYGFSGHCLLAERENGDICGVLPMVAFRQAFRTVRLMSLPYCDVGGALFNSDAVHSALQKEALRLAETLGAAEIEIRSAAVNDAAAGPAGKVRMLLELPSSSDLLLSGFKAKLRSQVRKPLREGVKAFMGGEELLDGFYRILAENMRYLGSPVHSRGWYQAILSCFGDRARICLVRTPDGADAAAALALYCGNTVAVPWASSLRRHNRLNPNMLLYWTLLAHAADSGMTRFDFGRSTPGSGTYKFKEQWGARPEPIAWITLDKAGMRHLPLGRPSRTRSLAESVWPRLPLFVCNCVGPLVRRQISL